MLVRATVCLLVLLALAVLPGCVYYNTFYHAREAAREAELLRQERPPDSDPTIREMELLGRVVEKSGRVVKLHPDSEWADDALLLLGTALYLQGKYESAEDRLAEFLTLYPESELRPEAECALAAVLLARGDPISAEAMLEDVAYADPPGPLSDDALVLIGQARQARGRREEAAEAYDEVLERFPGSDRRAEIRFLAAENCAAMGRLEEAAAHFSAVADEKGSRQMAFEARVRLVEISLELGDTATSLEVLEDLVSRTTARDDLDRVLLLTGRTHEATGDLDEAISTYEGMAVSHERSEAAAEAYYRIGLIHRDDRRLLDDAVSFFEKAKSEAARSEAARLAEEAISDINEFAEYLDVIVAHTEVESSLPDSSSAGNPEPSESDTLRVEGEEPYPKGAPADSTGTDDPDSEVAIARFRIAELYLFKLNNLGEALSYYRAVLEMHPESEMAPKAAFAVAWILENRTGDTDGAAEAYLEVMERFPDTEFAAAAQEARSRLLGEDGGAPE